MQGKFKFEFLGLNSFPGKKDPSKTYFNVNLLQGTEVQKVFLDEGQDLLFTGLSKMDEIEVVLDVTIKADRTYTHIVSVATLENGKPVVSDKVTDIKKAV